MGEATENTPTETEPTDVDVEAVAKKQAAKAKKKANKKKKKAEKAASEGDGGDRPSCSFCTKKGHSEDSCWTKKFIMNNKKKALSVAANEVAATPSQQPSGNGQGSW